MKKKNYQILRWTFILGLICSIAGAIIKVFHLGIRGSDILLTAGLLLIFLCLSTFVFKKLKDCR